MVALTYTLLHDYTQKCELKDSFKKYAPPRFWTLDCMQYVPGLEYVPGLDYGSILDLITQWI